ncbi:hypothetical protein E2C01_066318 [Portunus trituberculatus]|uniref:Uncharacterized protein n=1 Tax=Portunus trituberculatus TaxID=210409 RepID=A0A5B7HQQ2_PORTR|nr:hypothetical protein [Portunus trituberculatus]
MCPSVEEVIKRGGMVLKTFIPFICLTSSDLYEDWQGSKTVAVPGGGTRLTTIAAPLVPPSAPHCSPLVGLGMRRSEGVVA